jgi:hypothetical protein
MNILIPKKSTIPALIILAAMLLIIPADLFAGRLGINAGSPLPQEIESGFLGSITISGLKKTREQTILSLIDLPSGTSMKEVDLSAMEQRLRRTDLFGDIDFYLKEQQPGVWDMEVEVKERISLIGLPVVAWSGGSLLIGTTIFEANFLGLRRIIVASGFYRFGEGAFGSVGYIDPTLADGNATIAIFTGGGSSNGEHLLADDTPFRSFDGSSLSLAAQLRGRTKKRLQPGISLKYEGVYVDSWESESMTPIDSAVMAGGSLGLAWEELIYLRFFNKGLSAATNIGGAYNFRNSDNGWFYYGDASASWTASIFTDHLFGLDINAGFSQAPPPLLDALAGPGFRVLPSGGSIDRRYLSGALTWEVPLLRFSWGTGTTALFFDGGIYDPDNGSGLTAFYGPGGGIRLYLDKVVFPALQLNIGWNIPSQTSQFSFALGVRM